jgi:uncharacterized protein
METDQILLNPFPLFIDPKLNTRHPGLNSGCLASELRTPNSEHSSPIQVLSTDLVLVDWGPMTLTLSVWRGNQPRPVIAVKAAVKALELLIQLADFRNLLKIPSAKLINDEPLPPLVKKAFTACRKVSEELTGMAVVAGLAGDEIVKTALSLGGDQVIVNNGGDIALKVGEKQEVRVGLKNPGEEKISHVLEIHPGLGIGGVATSGWPGRSFSPGVADAVTVWAADGATADAAATWIAGQMKLDSPKVLQVPARELDPETDIPHLHITRDVAPLTFEEKEKVLEIGLAVAGRLIEKEVIRGVFLTVQGVHRWIAHQAPFPEFIKGDRSK